MLFHGDGLKQAQTKVAPETQRQRPVDGFGKGEFPEAASGIGLRETATITAGQHLTQKERARLIEQMKQAARILSSDPDAVTEFRELAEEGVADWVESIEREDRAAGADPDEKWWE